VQDDAPPPEPAEQLWDLVVVGAGPAGACAALGALRADPGLRVLLLDRADFPRDKSCGDGIAPHVVDALASVGAADVVDGWAPLTRLELARDGSWVRRALPRPVWVVPRTVLDARLVGHATRAGAVLHRRRVRSVAPSPDRPGEVLVDGTLRARVVVGADGAHSVVRPAAGLRPSRRRALAIRGYAPTPAGREGSQYMVYGHRRQPSYAWSFDRGDGLSNVGYGELLGDHRAPPSRALLLDQLEHLVPGAASTGSQWQGHHLPLSDWRWQQPDGPVLLAGDAAGLINPVSGEGIYYAVVSGLSAGRAAAGALAAGHPGRAGAAHRAGVRGLLGRHLRHSNLASRLSALPAVVDAGIRGAARDQRTFDDLVELALGRGLLTGPLLGGLAQGLLAGARASIGAGPPAQAPARDQPTDLPADQPADQP
jgi:geranylgeranyl reductase family protein